MCRPWPTLTLYFLLLIAHTLSTQNFLPYFAFHKQRTRTTLHMQKAQLSAVQLFYYSAGYYSEKLICLCIRSICNKRAVVALGVHNGEVNIYYHCLGFLSHSRRDCSSLNGTTLKRHCVQQEGYIKSVCFLFTCHRRWCEYNFGNRLRFMLLERSSEDLK